MKGKERFFNALEGKPVDRVPVFPLLMFFSAKRAGLSYRRLVTDGHAMAEAQLLAAQRFPIDAITACTDAMRVPADMGAEMVFPEDGTPQMVDHPIKTGTDLSRLRRPDSSAGRMADRVAGVRLMADNAGDDCAVLGWVEMPYAEASTLVGVADFMILAMEDPVLAHRILDFLTDIEIEFALAQIEAGADMIGAGDAAASLVSPEMYMEFALPYEQRVIDAVHAAGSTAKLHICGNTSKHLPYMIQSGADLYNVDHMVPFKKAVEVYGGAGVCFKGNLDPVADFLECTREECAERAERLIELSSGAKYMLSAGCEIPRDTPDEVFDAFCSAPAMSD